MEIKRSTAWVHVSSSVWPIISYRRPVTDVCPGSSEVPWTGHRLLNWLRRWFQTLNLSFTFFLHYRWANDSLTMIDSQWFPHYDWLTNSCIYSAEVRRYIICTLIVVYLTCSVFNVISINQSINHISIAPISLAWHPNQCSSAKSMKQLHNVNRKSGMPVPRRKGQVKKICLETFPEGGNWINKCKWLEYLTVRSRGIFHGGNCHAPPGTRLHSGLHGAIAQLMFRISCDITSLGPRFILLLQNMALSICCYMLPVVTMGRVVMGHTTMLHWGSITCRYVTHRDGACGNIPYGQLVHLPMYCKWNVMPCDAHNMTSHRLRDT